MDVIKRDGTIQEYDFLKVINAVNKAFKSINQDVPEKFIEQLKLAIDAMIIKYNGNPINIEDIQNIIQKELIKRNKYDAVEAFILYRKKRAEIREQKSDLIKEITKKLSASDIQNQNANIDEYSFGGRIGEASAIVTKNLALKTLVSKKARTNHESNEIYIHDLDAYYDGRHNCLSMPFDKLLSKGFKTRQTDVRPASSLNTAFQLIAVLFQLQSLNQFGGVSATHLDWTMVPYVRKSFFKHYKDALKYIECLSDDEIKEFESKVQIDDVSIDDSIYKKYSKVYKYSIDMLQKECHQAVEGMYHNLNTLQSRSGCQLPFTSINYGTCTLPEGRMVIKELLDVSIEGLGTLSKTSIFPCGIFQYMKGVNDKEGTPNYDLYRLALKSTSLRLYPNYANVDWSGNAGYDRNDPKTYFSTMGCRTVNGADINGMGQTKDGRGNICPVTIIMPTLAMEAKRKCEAQGNTSKDKIISAFMALLDKKISESKDMLLERFAHICSQNAKSATFMYDNATMEGYVPEEGIISALKHGTLTIGQLGLSETLYILVGEDQTKNYGMELAKKIESLYKQRCAEFKQEYHLNFGVYYTPAENLCYTSFNKWKAKYGELENVTYYIDSDGVKHNKKYFTNSNHVPVYIDINPFEKIDIESELTGYSTAGCITYVELPSTTVHNIDALETIVDYAMDKDIPYFAINVPNDQCQNCGWTGEINDKCPKCGCTDIMRLRRVTGYLTGNYATAFNEGKQKEVEQRTKHIKN